MELCTFSRRCSLSVSSMTKRMPGTCHCWTFTCWLRILWISFASCSFKSIVGMSCFPFLCLRLLCCGQFAKPCEKHLSVDQLKPGRDKWRDEAVLAYQGCENRSRCEEAFCGTISLKNAHKRPYIVRRYEVRRFECFDRIYHADNAEPLLFCNDISTVITAAGR